MLNNRLFKIVAHTDDLCSVDFNNMTLVKNKAVNSRAAGDLWGHDLSWEGPFAVMLDWMPFCDHEAVWECAHVVESIDCFDFENASDLSWASRS